MALQNLFGDLALDASVQEVVSSLATAVTRLESLLAKLPDQSAGTMPVSADSLPLPTGAATEATLASVAAEVAQDATVQAVLGVQGEVRALNDTMLYFVTALLEKLPMLNINDQALVSVQNTITANIAASQTLSVLTTLQNLAGGNTALLPFQLGGMPAYISDNIKVS